MGRSAPTASVSTTRILHLRRNGSGPDPALMEAQPESEDVVGEHRAFFGEETEAGRKKGERAEVVYGAATSLECGVPYHRSFPVVRG